MNVIGLGVSVPVSSVEAIRARFPALEREVAGRPVAYFDGPGGTQVPREVVEAMGDYLYNHNANTHWNYPTSQETDNAIAAGRFAMADFLGATAAEIAFGANMTTLTFHLARALGRAWGPGDEVVVTELDHHGNVAPWQALARERGITLRTVPFVLETGELDWAALKAALSSKTRLLAIGAASNALGTVSDIPRAVTLAKAVGALVFVDAVHLAAHLRVDVRAFGCDFLACSSYKFYGPHLGILFARAELIQGLDVPKLEPAPEIGSERLETGTQNHEGIVGARAAVDFLASLAPGGTRSQKLDRAMAALHARGQDLVERLWSGLTKVPGVRLYGPPPARPRTSTVSFTLAGHSAADVAAALADRALFVSHGDFYATTVAKRYGQSEAGLIRVGCACYSTEEEVDRIVAAVELAGS